jgi:predicted DNA binding CopG/RHH family protein
MNKPKKIPKFKTSAEEAYFWEKNDTTDYIDWSKAKRARFTNLKPSTRTISLRLPEGLLNTIKVLANKEDVPYQSLMKILLSEGIQHHRG